MSQKKIVSNSEIGERIRRRRLELAMSQEELALKLDVTYQQVQRYESGKNCLKVEKLQRIAHALSIPASCFLAKDESAHIIVSDESEVRLLSGYRKIRDDGFKEMMQKLVDLTAHGHPQGQK